ncbi:Probable ATP-dependent RNA helicase prh1, partial [Durusdinium trenchii]
DIVKAVRQHRVVVLVGETGSGKTTHVPRFLYEENVSNRPGSISITQPRRIAAISVANRVASELGCEVGGLVGFHVRFSNRTSSETRIKYMTDGMLVRESAAGGLRSGIRGSSIVILDEAHERSIHTDVLLGLVKKALDQDDPPGLRVVVMSATIHAAPFVNFFGSKEVKLIQVPGRQHAVQVFYTPSPEPDVLEAALVAVLQLHVSRPPGDVLVFLPGQDDIDNLHRLLEEKQEMLAKERQENPDKKVVQQGDFYNGVNLWPTFQQAGQVKQGTEPPMSEFDKLLAQTPAEILRVDMASVYMDLKALGISKIVDFPLVDRPPREALEKAAHFLCRIGALDTKDAFEHEDFAIAHLKARCKLAKLRKAIAKELGNSAEVPCVIYNELVITAKSYLRVVTEASCSGV